MIRAPRLKVLAVDSFEQPFKLRLPFRFGVITVTEGVQAIVRVHARLEDGREGTGFGAEALGAKWFDKNPLLSDEQNLHQLRRALELCVAGYRAAPWLSAFDLFAEHYAPHQAAAARLGLPPLVAGYGPALVDRAVLDALCRIEGLGFGAAMRANLAGIRPHAVAADLGAFDFDAFLATLTMADSIAVRHTVGLVDPIVAADQAPGTRVTTACRRRCRRWSRPTATATSSSSWAAQRDADVERLTRIAGVLDRIDAPIEVTLDGNEQFEDAASVAAAVARTETMPALRRLCDARCSSNSRSSAPPR